MKKSFSNLLVVAGMTILITSCTKTPEACFISDKGKIAKLNEEVQYDASCSKDADSYTWNFGDGITGTGVLTKHKYPNTGVYNVVLTAHHSSNSATMTQTITINP